MTILDVPGPVLILATVSVQLHSGEQKYDEYYKMRKLLYTLDIAQGLESWNLQGNLNAGISRC